MTVERADQKTGHSDFHVESPGRSEQNFDVDPPENVQCRDRSPPAAPTNPASAG